MSAYIPERTFMFQLIRSNHAKFTLVPKKLVKKMKKNFKKICAKNISMDL